MVFVIREPPPLSFFKINFSSSVVDGGARSGAGFVPGGLDLRVLVAGGVL